MAAQRWKSCWSWLAGLALGVASASASAWAAPCTQSGSTAPIDINVPVITVPSNAAVGTVLAEVSGTSNRYWLECSTANNYITSTPAQPIRGSTMAVVDQNGQDIPGLGMRIRSSIGMIRAANGDCGGVNVTILQSHQLTCRIYSSINGNPVGMGFGYGTLTVSFVKTSSALSSAAIAAQNVVQVRTDSYSPILFRLTASRIISNPCSFDIPASVSLGTVALPMLAQDGASAPVPFRMRVNCAQDARYKLTFSPAPGSAAVDTGRGILANNAAPAVAAQGVNVQLLDANGNAVALDKALDHGAQAASSAVNYQARMVSAGASAAGQVRAGVVVNFTFY